jgi:hypothetical protein
MVVSVACEVCLELFDGWCGSGVALLYGWFDVALGLARANRLVWVWSSGCASKVWEWFKVGIGLV